MNEINPLILSLVNQVIEACHPEKVILVSNKFNTRQELISFKLCIVVNDVLSTAELEGQLYLKTDCPIPFDIIIYNKSEWEDLIEDFGSFAEKVNSTGVVIYG